jgi:hypothetical protein
MRYKPHSNISQSEDCLSTIVEIGSHRSEACNARRRHHHGIAIHGGSGVLPWFACFAVLAFATARGMVLS